MGAGRTLSKKHIALKMKRYNELRAKYPIEEYPYMNNTVLAERLGLSRGSLNGIKKRWAKRNEKD